MLDQLIHLAYSCKSYMKQDQIHIIYSTRKISPFICHSLGDFKYRPPRLRGSQSLGFDAKHSHCRNSFSLQNYSATGLCKFKFLVIFLEFIFENKPFPSRKNLTLQSFYYIKDNVFVCLLLVEIQTME